MGFQVGNCRLPLCGMEEVAAERLMASLRRYGLVQERETGSFAALFRQQRTLLRRSN